MKEPFTIVAVLLTVASVSCKPFGLYVRNDAEPQSSQKLLSGEKDASSTTASIVFVGAADASFTQSFSLDGQEVPISNKLSISHIQGAASAKCIFNGIDGSVTTVNGNSFIDVGPPQTQVSGKCNGVGGEPPEGSSEGSSSGSYGGDVGN